MSEIGCWLEQHGLGKYTEVFVEHEIEFDVLEEITLDELKELGIPLGARKRILKAVATLAEVSAQSSELSTQSESSHSSKGDAERRQLTVMFCDLVGSTALSESMDAEDYRDLLGAYQTAAASSIREHGGYIARYMGDGLLVYFGYPVAKENDPERAARAGLAVIDAVATLDSSEPLAVRVGIATGPVVVGDIVGEGASEEAAVLGETPNLAARLQGAAAPNAILISPTTQSLLNRSIETEALAPMSLKGLTRPIVAYRVVRTRSLSEVSEARLDSTPLIGRDVELALLQRAWKRTEASEGQAVLLNGEPGVGKSRLLRAFQHSLGAAERIRVRWHCSPYHQTTANFPAIEQIRRNLGTDAQSDDRCLDALETMVTELGLDPEIVVPSLAILLSLPLHDRYSLPDWSQNELKRRLFSAQIELLEAAARNAPVLFLIEDLHWADPTSLEVIGEIIVAIRSARVLIVMTARPEFDPTWTELPHATVHRLNSLSRNETMALVNSFVQALGLSSEVTNQIVERSDGVPLFVEELARSLLESTSDAGIPASVQDSLMARLDRLGAAKELAQFASVVGRVFRVDDLEVLAHHSLAEVAKGLQVLVDTGLVYKKANGFYEFKHALVRDAAYASMLRTKRRDLHARYAEHLNTSDARTYQPEFLARHYLEAGMHEEAVTIWMQAGSKALDRWAVVESVSNFRAALESLSLLSQTLERRQTEVDINVLLGQALIALEGMGHEAPRAAFERAVCLSSELADERRQISALRGLGKCQFSSEPAQAVRTGLVLKGLAKDAADVVVMTEAQSILTMSYYLAGEFSQAIAESEDGLALWTQEESANTPELIISHPGIELRRYSAMCFDAIGLRDKAVSTISTARQMAESLGRPFLHAHALVYYASLMLRQRRYEQALEVAELALQITESFEFKNWLALAQLFRGRALVALGEVKDGLRLATLGISAWYSPSWHSENHTILAAAFIDAGCTEEAHQSLIKAETFLETVGALQYASECRRLRAVVQGLQGASVREVDASLMSALELARAQNAHTFELHAAVDLAKLWKTSGENERARSLLEPIYSGFTEGLDTPLLIEAKTLLSELN